MLVLTDRMADWLLWTGFVHGRWRRNV